MRSLHNTASSAETHFSAPEFQRSTLIEYSLNSSLITSLSVVRLPYRFHSVVLMVLTSSFIDFRIHSQLGFQISSPDILIDLDNCQSISLSGNSSRGGEIRGASIQPLDTQFQSDPKHEHESIVRVLHSPSSNGGEDWESETDSQLITTREDFSMNSNSRSVMVNLNPHEIFEFVPGPA